MIYQNLFYRLDHPTGILTMTAATNSQMECRMWYFEFVEEDIRHVFVEMLSRMNDCFGEADLAKGSGYNGSLDELRPGTQHCDYLLHEKPRLLRSAMMSNCLTAMH